MTGGRVLLAAERTSLSHIAEFKPYNLFLVLSLPLNLIVASTLTGLVEVKLGLLTWDLF
jgi:hypothetical protein